MMMMTMILDGWAGWLASSSHHYHRLFSFRLSHQSLDGLSARRPVSFDVRSLKSNEMSSASSSNRNLTYGTVFTSPYENPVNFLHSSACCKINRKRFPIPNNRKYFRFFHWTIYTWFAKLMAKGNYRRYCLQEWDKQWKNNKVHLFPTFTFQLLG